MTFEVRIVKLSNTGPCKKCPDIFLGLNPEGIIRRKEVDYLGVRAFP